MHQHAVMLTLLLSMCLYMFILKIYTYQHSGGDGFIPVTQQTKNLISQTTDRRLYISVVRHTSTNEFHICWKGRERNLKQQQKLVRGYFPTKHHTKPLY